MTKRFLNVLAVASVVAVLSPLFVSIQAAEVKCAIPFTFTVNGTTLPAGTYTLSSENNAMVIRSQSRTAIVLSNRMESRTAKDMKAVFLKVGDQYFLSEVWMGGGNGRELPKPKTNIEKLGANTPVERVVINAM
jgi:hypothetical protein